MVHGMTTDPIELLKERQRGQSLRSLAKQIPCSAAYLSDVFRGQRAPGPKILKFLGLESRKEPEVVYRRAVVYRRVVG